MAHIYHGSDDLILTHVNRQNFNTGLSRIDATYKCRTTRANFLEPQLFAGLRLPGYSDFIILNNANRVDGTDGFTTFTSSAFYGTLVTSPDALNLIPSILGAQQDILTQMVYFTTYEDFTNPEVNMSNAFTGSQLFAISIISDTLTRTFTMLPTTSINQLDVPNQILSFKATGATYYGDQVVDNSLLNRIKEKLRYTTNIININRSNFGGFDEVQVTWGISFDTTYRIVVKI